MLNGCGKGIARGRLTRDKGASILARSVSLASSRDRCCHVNDTLLNLALKHNLAVYDASYLSLVPAR